MRVNKFVAQATGLSRRAVDAAIEAGRVLVNDKTAKLGQVVVNGDSVTIDGQELYISQETTTIMLNKPRGYVCSREGQGSKTIYDLLPEEYHSLKPVGRLDKDSTGLMLLTNNGNLAHELTHPKFQKTKVYEARLDKPLSQEHFEQITKIGVGIGDDRPSTLQLQAIGKAQNTKSLPTPNYFLPFTKYWRVTMSEGRNRQIRRTFDSLGYTVISLHRFQFGPHIMPNDLQQGQFIEI